MTVRCQAITGKVSRYKDSWWAQCQNSASYTVHGAEVCATHLNQGFRHRLKVLAEIPLLTDDDL